MVKLTYGFCSVELSKKISYRIAPELDQHAAHEKNKRGNHVCKRLGAAVDFLIEHEDMKEVANWVAINTPFDRVYYYGPERPIGEVTASEHEVLQRVRVGPGNSLTRRNKTAV